MAWKSFGDGQPQSSIPIPFTDTRFAHLRATSCIPPEEKESIRQVLLQRFDIPERQVRAIPLSLVDTFSINSMVQVALQTAQLIAKIARFDFPSQWPTLLPVLFDAVSKSPSLTTLYTLHAVIKSLVSISLPQAKQQFAAMAKQMFHYLMPFMLNALEAKQYTLALMSGKALRRLVVFGGDVSLISVCPFSCGFDA